MRANLELLPRLLIDVRTAQHRVTLNPGRKRDRPVNDRPRPLCRMDNFGPRLIANRMIVGFHANADSFLFFPGHSQIPFSPNELTPNQLTPQQLITRDTLSARHLTAAPKTQ